MGGLRSGWPGGSGLVRGVGAVVLSLGVMAAATGCGSSSSGSDGSKIVVRMSAPMSGTAAVYGQIAMGFEAFMKAQNDEGGIGGFPIDLKVIDNVESPDGGATTMLSLLADKPDVVAIVGSTPTQASLQVVKAKKIQTPVFAASNAGVVGDSGVKNAYGMNTDYLEECYYDTQYLIDKFHAKKIALVYEDDPVAQKEGTDCPAYGKALGVDVTAIPVSATTTDFNSIAAKVKATGAQAAQIYGLDALSASVIKASSSIGFNPQWMTFSGTSYDSFIKLAGAQGEGILVSSWMVPIDSQSAEADRFHAAMKKYYPQADNYLGAQGWTLAALAAYNLQKGIEANDGKIPSAEQLNEIIGQMNLPDGIGMSGGKMVYDGSASPVKELSVLQIKNGTLVTVAPPAPMPTAVP